MTAPPRVGKSVVLLVLWGGAAAVFSVALTMPFSGLAPLGTLLDPWGGLYRTARQAEHPTRQAVTVAGLEATATILRDERGVPHIFAESDRDAIIALGYVVAQDRLFQLDFLPRVAAGRLSEIFGAASLGTDRFLRRTGMEWGARRNAARIRSAGGLEHDLATWFALGANAYMEALDDGDLPFEIRLFGYRPEPYSLLQAGRLMQYFAYDLTYRSDDADYARLKERLPAAAYDRLYPRHAPLSVPIIPEAGGGVASRRSGPEEASPAPEKMSVASKPTVGAALEKLLALHSQGKRVGLGGYEAGKGSNNWVVGPAQAATGAPILAGDMHLSLTLPAIWYEVHLVTPTMNTYGVTAPGAPLPIEAFNDHLAWAFTNTGADVIDHYALDLDESGTRYRFEDAWRDLDIVPDTIRVKGGEPVIDTLYYAHWGPVVKEGDDAIATRWVAHEPSRTLRAVWEMNHAQSMEAFQEALRFWDTPMQNIAAADVDGNIAIRSTGYLPVRRAGHGMGLLDGSSGAFDWIGRVPFDELPHSINPAQGFLASTNQEPADSTYPYYLGHDWRSTYRSLRIDQLLRNRPAHTVADFKRYQADVHAVQRDLFVPLLDSLSGLSERADSLRRMLGAWTGDTGVDRSEPLVLDEFLRALRTLVWDESVFDGAQRPAEPILYRMLRETPDVSWLDVQATPAREGAREVLRQALETTADTLAARYGWDAAAWRWGDHHKVTFRHITQTPALRPLWRGPFEYPGFASTLSPASGRITRHSASWRVVVDLSQTPPVGYGVYPGGQRGHPFSARYDDQVSTYVEFNHYSLLKPVSAEAFDPDRVSSRLLLQPH